MSSDDGSRRRRQAFQGAVSPAGVGTSVSNQVSPDTLQELEDTEPIDQAFANMGIADMRAYLDALPPPNSLLAPTGIGSRASNSPVSSGARTPASHISVPSAGGSRDATGVGSVNRNNRSRSRSQSRSRSSTPRARVPGARRGRARRGRGPRVRGGLTRRPLHSSPISPRSQNSTPSYHPRNLNQADLQRRLQMLMQDQEQLAQGREIKNITMTNSIVTSYKQGGSPSVQTNSSRLST